MKPQRTRAAGGPRPDIHPPDCQTHKHAENFLDKKRERSSLAAKDKRALAFVRDSMPAPIRNPRSTAEGGSKKRHFYRPLLKKFRRDGFDYRQIAREGNTAIYKQTWDGCPDAGVCFEVIRIRCREGFEIGGRFVEAAELYPNSEAWGVDGFTLTDRDAAFAKLRALRSGG
jgi:hypothetical protein